MIVDNFCLLQQYEIRQNQNTIAAIDRKRARLQKKSVFLRIQVRASSKTKGLERGWKQWARLGRDAKNTIVFFFLSLSLSLSTHTHALWAYACEARALCARQNLAADFWEKNGLFYSL